MANDGKTYEHFVQNLYQALLDSEDITKQRNTKIEKNKKILDNCGIEREFDLYWEYEIAGITYKTIIECKDYKSRVSVEKIDALIGKVRDIPDLRPVFATKTGYQSGAEAKAKSNKIDLLIVREQTDKDWQDSDGNSFIKELFIDFLAQFPARIIKFSPKIDGNWVKKNTDIDTSEPLNLNKMNNSIFIHDIAKDEQYSLYDLEQRLGVSPDGKYGNLTHSDSFDNAFLVSDELRLKLDSYYVEYIFSPPASMPIHIDYTKELIGVIEYLHKKQKTAIFTDKIIKDWK